MTRKGFDAYFEVLWPSAEVMAEPDPGWGSLKTVSRYRKLVHGPQRLICAWCKTNIDIGCIVMVNREGDAEGDQDRRGSVKCRDCYNDHIASAQGYYEVDDVAKTFTNNPCGEDKLCFTRHLTAEFRGNS